MEIISSPKGMYSTSSQATSLKKAYYAIPAVTSATLADVYRGAIGGYAIGTSGTILKYDTINEKWRIHTNSGLTAQTLYGIDMSSISTELVAVGGNGTLVRGTILANGEYAFIEDAQSAVLTTEELHGVRWLYQTPIGGANRIIAVGDNGTILRYDSSSWGVTTWSAVSSSITEALLGVDGTPGTDVVAVGYNGGIYRSADDGLTWSEWVAAGDLTSSYLWGIDVSSSTNMWACGDNGVVLHYDGSSWNVVPTPTTNGLTNIWMLSDSDGYAVGTYGTIIHWDGNEWTQMTSPTTYSLAAISGSSINTLSIVGALGITINYYGDVLPTQLVDRGGVIQPRPLTEESSETQVFTDEEIRDTLAHNSIVADCSRYKYATVHIDNDLNQIVSIQMKVNRTNSVTGAVDVGAPFDVAATSGIEMRTLTPETCGWSPYLFAEATCAVAPASGDVNAYINVRN